MLLYLTDVEEGGETVFLFEGKEGLKRLAGVDYKACNTGIKVKPRAGDALLFWSQNPDTTVDKHSLHGGCPVVGFKEKERHTEKLRKIVSLVFFYYFSLFSADCWE